MSSAYESNHAGVTEPLKCINNITFTQPCIDIRQLKKGDILCVDANATKLDGPPQQPDDFGNLSAAKITDTLTQKTGKFGVMRVAAENRVLLPRQRKERSQTDAPASFVEKPPDDIGPLIMRQVYSEYVYHPNMDISEYQLLDVFEDARDPHKLRLVLSGGVSPSSAGDEIPCCSVREDVTMFKEEPLAIRVMDAVTSVVGSPVMVRVGSAFGKTHVVALSLQ